MKLEPKNTHETITLIRSLGLGPTLAAMPTSFLAKAMGIPDQSVSLHLGLRLAFGVGTALVLMRCAAVVDESEQPENIASRAGLLFAAGIGGALTVLGGLGLAVAIFAFTLSVFGRYNLVYNNTSGLRVMLGHAAAGGVLALFCGIEGFGSIAVLSIALSSSSAAQSRRLPAAGGLVAGGLIVLGATFAVGPLPSSDLSLPVPLQATLFGGYPLSVALVMFAYWGREFFFDPRYDRGIVGCLLVAFLAVIVFPTALSVLALAILLIILSANFGEAALRLGARSIPVLFALIAIFILTLWLWVSHADAQAHIAIGLVLAMLFTGVGWLFWMLRRSSRSIGRRKMRGSLGPKGGHEVPGAWTVLVALSMLSAVFFVTQNSSRDTLSGPRSRALTALAQALPGCLPHIGKVDLWAVDDQIALHFSSTVARVERVTLDGLADREPLPDTILITPEPYDIELRLNLVF